MQNIHAINYTDFSPNELCTYLEERYYTQIINDFENTKKYLKDLLQDEYSQNIDLVNSLFYKLEGETTKLFARDRILLFPHITNPTPAGICLKPMTEIHQRIIDLLQKIRGFMNNYVPQPLWSTNMKICCNELYVLEQEIQYVLYIKENFLWTRINNNCSGECNK